MEDLVEGGESHLSSTYQSLYKYKISGDFRFIIIRRIYYAASSHNSQLNMLMNLYFIIKRIGISEIKALGLDISVVTIERVPLVVSERMHVSRIWRVMPEE